MRLAVIDIGTNSVKLSVAEADRKVLTLIEEASRSTRLGEGVDLSKRLLPAAMQRTLDTVDQYISRARALGAARIVAVGSSALRDALNGREFQDRVKAETGIEVEIIAGAREAELAFKSVACDSTFAIGEDQPFLVFDIGGGSTELICGRGTELLAHDSLDIGAVRLTERHLKTDPPTEREYADAVADASDSLRGFPGCRQETPLIFGIGGTGVNIASVAAGSAASVHGAIVTIDQFTLAVQRLRECSLEQRKKIGGLEPARADIIIGGAAILQAIFDIFPASGYRVSVRGMRYGLLAEMAHS